MDSYIEQFFKNGEYITPDECHYDNEEELLQCGVFGFCGCGLPEDNLKYIRDGLHHINNLRLQVHTKKCTFENWKKDGIEIFGNKSAEYFFYYWADTQELSEHGGSVPGWLTEKGEQILNDLDALLL